MKKLITVLLILALLLPLSALADDSVVVGCWASYTLLTDGAPNMSMLFLAENHSCYYIIQSFYEDEVGLGRTYIGTWEMLSNGTVHAKTGNYAEINLEFYGDYSFAVDESMNVYVNITPYKLN